MFWGDEITISNKNRNIILFTGSSLAVLLVIYYFVGNYYNSIKTETVYQNNAQRVISTKLFVVRDEKIINKEIEGTVVPLVSDGEKLAKGDVYAVVCGNSNDAAVYLEKNQINKDLTRYEQLNTEQSLNTVDIDKIDKDIDRVFINFLNAASSDNYKNLDEAAGEYRDKLTSRQIALNSQKPNFSIQINSLKEKLAKIEILSISAQSLISDYSGYFVSHVDGYENTISYDNIDKSSATDIENAMLNQNLLEQSKSYGKIVCSYNWYLLASLENDQAAELKIGDEKNILVGRNGEVSLTTTIYAINPSQSGKTSVVFVCNQMNEKYANMRIEDAKIVLSEYKGYKIKSSALRMLDDVQGTYVVRGNVIGFRKVNVVESKGDYVIAEINLNNSQSTTPYSIELYDEVVVEGKNLYEGKIIRR